MSVAHKLAESRGVITVVVGAQTGSEGKGLIVGHIAGGYDVHVRVGAANAGHTVYVEGEKHVLQQLPCAAYANPFAKLVLGAGAMVSAEVLEEEILANVAWRKAHDLPELQLSVDERAHVVLGFHVIQEGKTDLEERIGSTSATAREGIGAAQAARVMRTHYELAKDSHLRDMLEIRWVDTVSLLHDAKLFASVLLEGTQGTGLDNVLGTEYPYVTSRHVTASGLLADCGLGPKDADHVLIVARTFPIRVAGNSGPFWPDSHEIAWADIGVDEQTEKTTVTRRVRRVATFSHDQIQYAVKVNGATEIALTFGDYLAPELGGRNGVVSAESFDVFDYVGPMVRRIEEQTLTPVVMVGTGPDSVLDRQPGIEPALLDN